MSTLTARQSAELERIVRNVQEHFNVQIRGVEDLNIHYEEESRPGRGHRIRFDYIDSDHAVSGYMDVYGDTNLAVGVVDFIHDSGDEECDCTLCPKEES
jgi:hypothetical protein